MTVATSVVDYINARDHRLMHRVHRWRAPRWIRLWMICATRGGDGWLWYITAAALLIGGGEMRFRAVLSATLAVAAGSLVFVTLKRLTGRKRPCHIAPHCWANLLPPDQFSFPSGHTIAAFAVATPVSLFYADLAFGMLFLAISVAASRILLGMHFLSDVVAGAAIGAGIGLAFYGLCI